MSRGRKLELVHGDVVPPPPSVIKWDKCVICQEDTEAPLINAKDTGLKSLGEDLIAFNELGVLPKSVLFSQIEDGQGVVESLLSHSAKFHKVCRTKFDKQKLDRQRKKQLQVDSSASSSSNVHTRSKISKGHIKNTCLFCDGDETVEKLVTPQTLEIGTSILFLAKELHDDRVLSKLSSADLVAQEAKYHKRCYVRFRTTARSELRKNANSNNENEMNSLVYGSALSQMVEYIQDMYLNSEISPVFKLAILTSQMEAKMRNLGVADAQVHRSKLKDQLISLIPGLVSCKSGREVMLYFEESTADALRDAIAYNSMSDGMTLAHAAKIIRRDLFNNYPKFTGSFSKDFVPKKCVSESLVLLLQMILEGSDTSNNEAYEKTAVLSLAQLVRFNAVKFKRRHDNSNIKHLNERETPLPLYIGLKLYSTVRSKNLIDSLFALGLSVSYDRVQYVLSTVTNVICESYETSEGVLPSSLHRDTFTTAVIDNIDHNQSSTSAQKSFHGTSITLIQHPDKISPDESFLRIEDSQWSRRVTKELPYSYTVISPLVMNKNCNIPLNNVVTPAVASQAYSSTVDHWLHIVKELLEADDGLHEMRLSWAGFTSEIINSENITTSNHVLLPLLNEKVQSPAVVAHCLKLISSIINKLNLNNGIPVLTGDQPIYALAKQLQWKFPHLYGEDKFVVMMGGLHIEMAIMSMIGSWLTGSGWTDILVDAGVTSPGRAESLLSCSHVKRTRYAHQVTVAALVILKGHAYKSREMCSEEPDLDFDKWCTYRTKESVQFLFWSITIELEVLLLAYVQSLRESNFINFKRVLVDICPWMFALDHTNYARWLPVFVKTLQELEIYHPSINEEFMKGKFVSMKTNRSFSAIADDQLHEQNNKKIKEIGGAIGLLDNPTALLKWTVGGPDIVKMISDFEEHSSNIHDGQEECDIDDEELPGKHRENTKSFEERFRKHVLAIVASFQNYGNPFEGDVLSTAVSNIRMTPDAEESVKEAKNIGNTLYNNFRLRKFERVDIVFDRYLPGSLKADTRLKRGSGKEIVVRPTTPMPKVFSKFLQCDNNKKQLFKLLSTKIKSLETDGKLVICTDEESVTFVGPLVDGVDLAPCSHEEADTRLLIHVKSAILSGHKNILISTVDSDVIVIAAAKFHELEQMGMQDLWFEFGVGKNRRYFSLSVILRGLSVEKCAALPFFHAYTGCDTVSSFHGIGKTRAWNVWGKMQEMTDVFIRLSSTDIITEEDFDKIQLFTVMMYDVTSQTETVNECRRVLYTQKNRSVENIPPTEGALRQHLRRAMLQSRIWIKCLELQPYIPNATNWGWKSSNLESQDETIEPLWTVLPQASDECSELISCRCKTMCIKNCKCNRFNLQCTALCTCDGQNARVNALTKIYGVLRELRPATTPEEIKVKFSSLRTTYQVEKCKMDEAIRSGADVDFEVADGSQNDDQLVNAQTKRPQENKKNEKYAKNQTEIWKLV
ncbi:unnamed protein product [Phaedon cochleariae]|uniref:Tesmin/TSO1-like CXC domain-containing protein n=1 Tax=Phaedon cochleariae TaxID=80249 RepID=A0A9N9X4W6_PHACE|nr:unnamed protein product [Phaedon cochleariae]